MNISIFGLGYVGAVSAACLSKSGHNIIGVDAEKTKVDIINNGKTPIIEESLAELIEDAVQNQLLRATTSANEAIANSELSFICVGTPSQLNGNLDLKFIRRVCEEIGNGIKSKKERHVVVIRSTILPGTMREIIIPILEQYSGKKAGKGMGVCNNPEFLREGTAVYDFNHPPKTVIGETDEQSGDILTSLYENLPAPLIRTDLETAEMVKYVDNIWHALKIGFANEIGNICKLAGLDSHKVMDIFCQDTKLNISNSYLKPGFAFGGSCLPKDLRALTYMAKRMDIDIPIINAILPSNALQVEKSVRMIIEKENKKIGILGFSFKAGTDDIRESPMVDIIEKLLGKGYDLRIYDRNVKMASLVGANRDYILNRIPHISNLMVGSIDDVISHADTLVIGNNDNEFSNIMSMVKKGQVVVDLVRIDENLSAKGIYDGICW